MNNSRRAFFKKSLMALVALPLLKSNKVVAAVACPQAAPKDPDILSTKTNKYLLTSRAEDLEFLSTLV